MLSTRLDASWHQVLEVVAELRRREVSDCDWLIDDTGVVHKVLRHPMACACESGAQCRVRANEGHAKINDESTPGRRLMFG